MTTKIASLNITVQVVRTSNERFLSTKKKFETNSNLFLNEQNFLKCYFNFIIDSRGLQFIPGKTSHHWYIHLKGTTSIF